MKLISFVLNGHPSFGAVVGDPQDGRVVDLGALLASLGSSYADLRALLGDPEGLSRAQAALRDAPADTALASLTLLPVIPNPKAIWCVGLAYHDHVQETNNKPAERPVLFQRSAHSQVAHGQAMVRPPESTAFDYEGEIAVVIGKAGRRISEDDAWSHIAGYACYNDGSIRDWQRHSPQWGPGKNFWRTGAFGPWLVTADEIPPGTVLTLTTKVNGQELQRATSDLLIHSIPRQIAYISTFTPLEPGDVIVTGTPGGVGAARKPQVWLRDGDLVEVEIDRVGVLSNRVADEVAAGAA